MCSIGYNLISMEEQVISRAHRMGASRPIHVETLAMHGTIEEQMVEFFQVNLYNLDYITPSLIMSLTCDGLSPWMACYLVTLLFMFLIDIFVLLHSRFCFLVFIIIHTSIF